MKKRKLFAPSEQEGGGKKILFNHEEGLDNKEGDQYEYPYETVHDDHCETPLKAYQDIQQAVKLLADGLGKTVAELKIYDPYYCEGNVIKRLNSLGEFVCYLLLAVLLFVSRALLLLNIHRLRKCIQ
jgi:hypothetical protein